MSGKILLVDDEQEIADLIEVFLQNEQFQCFKYYTFQDAFSVIDSECFDLAIIDIMLPDGNGFTLCREIRKKYTYPIILLTSKTEGTDKVTGLSLGADDYVTKPFLPITKQTAKRTKNTINAPIKCLSNNSFLYFFENLLLNNISYPPYCFNEFRLFTNIIQFFSDMSDLNHYRISAVLKILFSPYNLK